MEERKIYAPFKISDYRVIRPSAYLEKKGNKVLSTQQLSSFSIKDCKIEFVTPNPVSLFLNKSIKEYESALVIYKKNISPNLIAGSTFLINGEMLSVLYDYLEHIQSSIVTMYSAIEAMGNVAIPNTYVLSRKNNKGITETLTKENIERWVSTTEKVGKIVPEILNIETPAKESFWPNFLALKNMRDDIIHQKQSKNDPREIEETFMKLLLDEDVFVKIMAGFSLIKYFCAKDKTHRYFPIIENEFPINVNIVESFKDSLGLENITLPPT